MSAACLAANFPATAHAKQQPRGKAEHCIFIWLGGGAAQIDTWDPKERGDAKARKPGSYYDAIDTAISGVRVCEHLKQCAPILDRFNLIRMFRVLFFVAVYRVESLSHFAAVS